MMPKHNYLDIQSRIITEFTYKFYGQIMDKKLADKADKEYDATRELYKQVRVEYRSGKLKSRVRKFLNRNPMLVAALSEDDGDRERIGPKISRMIIDEMAMKVIEDIIGHHHIPRGIEAGDMWLAPATELQRMFQDKHGEDAIVLVVAKRDEETGKLEPGICWTNDEEVITEAQKGHRRYMELLAKENR